MAAQIAGSVGMAGAANIGERFAMFEAIHGSAPRRAGQNLANPSGLLNAAVMMLVHIGQPDTAELVRNAWLRTLEDGLHTYDIYTAERSSEKLGTREFGAAVAERLGQQPQHLAPASYADAPTQTAAVVSKSDRPRPVKETVGVDVFLDWPDAVPDDLAARVQAAIGDGLSLTMVSNRGVKVWPGGFGDSFLVDHWRCRFMPEPQGAPVSHAQIVKLLGELDAAGLDFVKTEHLCSFDGEPGYSLAQGE